MGDALCPKCRTGNVRSVHVIRREEVAAVFPYCDACGWLVGQAVTSLGAECGGIDGADRLVMEQVSSVAYWEPRPRLPTPEEEAAHREKHGEDAGWMYSWFDTERPYDGWTAYTAPLVTPLDRSIHAPVTIRFRSYPHVGGRPVGWP